MRTVKTNQSLEESYARDEDPHDDPGSARDAGLAVCRRVRRRRPPVVNSTAIACLRYTGQN